MNTFCIPYFFRQAEYKMYRNSYLHHECKSPANDTISSLPIKCGRTLIHSHTINFSRCKKKRSQSPSKDLLDGPHYENTLEQHLTGKKHLVTHTELLSAISGSTEFLYWLLTVILTHVEMKLPIFSKLEQKSKSKCNMRLPENRWFFCASSSGQLNDATTHNTYMKQSRC